MSSLCYRFPIGWGLVLAISGTDVLAQGLFTEQVASGLTNPLFATHAPGDADRLFIVEQGTGTTARIKILNLQTGTPNPDPFLQIPGVLTGGERGLLGLAFHPNYAQNGYFYVNHTAANPRRTVIQRFKVSNTDPDQADPTSAQTVLAFGQPYDNHNGGWIGFNPKIEPTDPQYLYIATGDGGSSHDPLNKAQDITNNLLGKMLRIDVDGDDFPTDGTMNYAIPPDNPFVGQAGDDELWAYGLRNPWRNSFDRKTGDLWIADVGQGSREEVDFQPASSTGGENYGWRCLEGTHTTGLVGCNPLPIPHVNPIHEYPRADGRSITGGYVYRGPITQARGLYFFADFHGSSGVGNSRIWSLSYDLDAGVVGNLSERSAELDAGSSRSVRWVSSFGEDSDGNLYLTDLVDGKVFKLVTDLVLGDMNGDGFADNGDINPFVTALSVNGDEASFNLLEPGAIFSAADTNGDGSTNNLDIPQFVTFLLDSGVSSATVAHVPEPATLLWFGAAAAGCLRRRHQPALPFERSLNH